MENFTEGLTLSEVSEIKRLLLEKNEKQPAETDRWFDLNEPCIYHLDQPCKPAIYSRINAGNIPVHENGKKLRFLKSVSIETGILRVNSCRYAAKWQARPNFGAGSYFWPFAKKSNSIPLLKQGPGKASKHRAAFYTIDTNLFTQPEKLF